MNDIDDLFVGRLMSSELYTVPPDTLVEQAAEAMLDRDIGSVVVVDDEGHLEGLLTTTDFVRIVAERKPKDKTPVSAYMTTDVVTTTARTSIRDAADAMVAHGFHHLPVVDDDDVVIGIITTTDLTAYVSKVEAPSPD